MAPHVNGLVPRLGVYTMLAQTTLTLLSVSVRDLGKRDVTGVEAGEKLTSRLTLACHGNFGPAKKLVRGTIISGISVRANHFFLKILAPL